MSNFTEKKLQVKIVLADDTTTVFTATGDNTLIVDRLRMSVNVTASANQASQAVVNIWGMLESDMNALTVAFQTFGALRQNYIEIRADNGNGYRLVFTGTIIEAQPDFRRAPDVSFQILAMFGYFKQIELAQAISFPNATDIDVFGRYFADQLGMSYVNQGAKATLTNQYCPGTVFDQLRQVAQAARINFYFQGSVLVFAPLGLPNEQVPAVVLSPTTGLIGYPMYSRQGLVVTAIYDPAFQCASFIEIQDSKVKNANGRWYPFSMEFNLQSNLPNGQWIATLQCNKGGA